jgi:hypothetical protein
MKSPLAPIGWPIAMLKNVEPIGLFQSTLVYRGHPRTRYATGSVLPPE